MWRIQVHPIWPKTLSDFAFGEARFFSHFRVRSDLAKDDGFRPGGKYSTSGRD